MVGEKLMAAGIITQDQLDAALEKSKADGSRVGDAIVALGFATEAQIEAALS